jgi:hypothetical protein
MFEQLYGARHADIGRGNNHSFAPSKPRHQHTQENNPVQHARSSLHGTFIFERIRTIYLF